MSQTSIEVYLEELRHTPNQSSVTLSVCLPRLHPRSNSQFIEKDRAERFLAECDKYLTPKIKDELSTVFLESNISVSYHGVRPGSILFTIVIVIGKVTVTIAPGSAATLAGGAVATYNAIAKYGDFEKGLKRITKRLVDSGNWIEDKAARTFAWITTGETKQIDRIDKLQKEAMEKRREEERIRKRDKDKKE